MLTKSGRKLIAVPAGRIGSLTVPLSVEEIGFGAFEESKLSEVLFHPDANILTFGYRAFFKASNITTITVPKSMVSIDYYAFAYCENLREVIFVEGNQLKGIYEGAFCGDINLETITIPNAIVEISDFAFYGCNKITQLPIADAQNLKGIYDYAFAYTGLNGAFVLPENVLDIGSYAFMGTKLQNVTISDAHKKDLVIGIGAFEDCNSLEEITLPFLGASYEDEQITWFGYIFGAGDYTANGTYVPESLKTVTLTEGITFIGWGGFAYCSDLQTIHMPHSVSSLQAGAFQEASARYTLTNTISIYNFGEPSRYFSYGDYGTGIYGHLSLVEGLEYISISECPGLTGIDIPDGVNHVEIMYSEVSELWFPDSVTYIYCPFNANLESVRLPATMEVLTNAAFAQCKNLSEVVFPENLKRIETGAFSECVSLTEIHIPEGTQEISSHVFSSCSALARVTLPESLTEIGVYAFSNCRALESITLPAGLYAIGTGAFAECTRLYEVNNHSDLELSFGSEEYGAVAMYARWIVDRNGTKTSLVENGDAAYVDTADGFRFLLENGEYTLISYSGTDEIITLPLDIQGQSYGIYKFRGGKHIILPEGMTQIPDEAFAGHAKLESIQIPDTVTRIGANTFLDCTSLKQVDMPADLAEIGYYAFSNCISLETVEIPAGITKLWDGAFANCSALQDVILPDGLEMISYGAFQFTGLKTLRLPASVYVIDADAFQGCPLETVEVDPGNQHFVQKDNILYNQDMSMICAVPSDITHAVIPASVTDVGSAFAYCTELESVEFEAGSNLRYLSSRAFAGCTSLKEIIWPENLEAIYYAAFWGCTALESVELPDTLLYLESEAFWDCTGLKQITFPASTDMINPGSFTGCENLQAIYVDPENPVYCSYDGIVYNKDLSQIVLVPKGLQGYVQIPEGITIIPDSAFEKCKAITEVRLPDSVTTIGNFAFIDCNALKKINLPQTVTTIGVSAFFNCTALETIQIPDGITQIEQYAFYGCEALERIVIPDTVTVIKYAAFMNSGLRQIVLSQSLTGIEDWAFDGCYDLLYMEIPEGVTYIGEYAFSACNSMLWVTLPQSLQDIGYRAFEACLSMREVRNNSDLPITCGSLDYGCVAEYAGAVVDRNGNRSLLQPEFFVAIHTTEDGFVFEQVNDTYKMVAYTANADTVTLPLTFQGSAYEIYQIDGIRHVIFPEGFERIPAFAFWGSTILEHVTLPSTVTCIDSGAFGCCRNLTGILISDSVTTIETWAFVGCEKLSQISLGKNITFLSASAFEEIPHLQDKAIWEDGALYLDRYLLRVDENCTSFTVREDTLLIAEGAFKNCNQLKILKTGLYNTSVFGACVNLETLILTRNTGELGSIIPMTLKNIVLTESFEWNKELDWFFGFVSNVSIFTEAKEATLRWDDNYPGWNLGNSVTYGEEWIWASFYDREGDLIQSTPQRTHAIVRLPYVKDEVGYAFAGWDLDGDGLADGIPATSAVDIHAHALFERVCSHSDVSVDAAVAPTCTEDGLTEGKHCSACGEVLVAQEKISALGHSEVIDAAVAPTCTETGLTEGSHCAVCGEVLVAQTVVEVRGHDYTSVVTAPTCTENGYTTHTCGNCGSTYTSDHVEALGHKHEAAVTEPTCTEAGCITYTCHCGDTYTEEIPALGHSYVDGICERCGAPEVTLGDVNGDGRVNARDARLLLRYAAGLADETELDLAAADYNGDGRVNARDARALLRVAAGLD